MIESVRFTNAENSTVRIEPYEVTTNYPADNSYSTIVDEWVAEGNTIAPYDPNYGLTNEQIQKRDIALAEQIVKSYVQIPIDAYNQANGVNFESVYNCTAYKDVATYPHKTMCIQAIEWNAQVWESARQLQINIALGNVAKPATEAEFISHLPPIPVFGNE